MASRGSRDGTQQARPRRRAARELMGRMRATRLTAAHSSRCVGGANLVLPSSSLRSPRRAGRGTRDPLD
eukprot:scaffold133426_cov70-Phaeocystis_antarctica.AAC.3